MILVSESIYSSRGIEWCNKNPNITQYRIHKVTQTRKKAKIGSTNTRDMILVHKSIYDRELEFIGASIKILKSRNHTIK